MTDAARIRLVIDVDVIDEPTLRRIAAIRMARSGYGGRISDHHDGDLGELAYQAMIGSNPDGALCDMGLEMVEYRIEGGGKKR